MWMPWRPPYKRQKKKNFNPWGKHKNTAGTVHTDANTKADAFRREQSAGEPP
jgi:hypothetical protein